MGQHCAGRDVVLREALYRRAGDTLEIRNTHYRVSGFDGIAGNVQAQEELGKLISSGMTEERGLVLKSFPDGGCNGWTISEFGPLYIPAKGSV